MALAGIQQFRSQGPVPVHACCTERVTRSERREGANRDGNGVDGERERDGDGDGDETVMGAETRR